MEVKELMNPGVVWVEPTATAALAARLLSRHNLGALPVCAGDGRLRGMVTDRDIVLRCVAAEEDPAQTQVKDIMTRNCAVVSPDDDAREATRLMAAKQVRRLPGKDSLPPRTGPRSPRPGPSRPPITRCGSDGGCPASGGRCLSGPRCPQGGLSSCAAHLRFFRFHCSRRIHARTLRSACGPKKSTNPSILSR